jgi:23S rRNA pseudouridine1911/1915/1917 synthase
MELAGRVLYCDNHLLVVAKQSGELAQADGSPRPDLLNLGKSYLKTTYKKPGNVFLGLVHRLDYQVSGVTVFARTSKAASRLSRQFRERSVEKDYIAVVSNCSGSHGDCQDYLCKEGNKTVICRENSPGAKSASLSWRLLQQSKHGHLLAIKLHSGRANQIRVQLASRHMPIIGDTKYGDKHSGGDAVLCLHCLSIAIDHPTRDERMVFSSLPDHWPQHFRVWLNEQGEHGK